MSKSKESLFVRILKKLDPEYRQAAEIRQAEMDALINRLDSGEPVENITIRLITEPTLEWNQELEVWTISTGRPIKDGKKLALLTGRGGAILEEAVCVRNLSQKKDEYIYVVQFAELESK